jgi:NAD(P)-dependent dehydrogenase (short-subunit alcohol dehydrogenase family)
MLSPPLEVPVHDFRGKLAVITGAGSGIGRALALELVREGAHVALCDLAMERLVETKHACDNIVRSFADEPGASAARTRVTAHACDVADEAQVIAFREAVEREHATDHIHLLFNNAGITGGGSFVHEERERWERTFNVCWFGVYHNTRAFLPLLMRSSEGCIVNVSSINAVFALDPSGPHTAYSAAKFAVKGFTEALLTDLRINAPHVRVALVMPGHIGTSIVSNSMRIQGMESLADMTGEELGRIREHGKRLSLPVADLSDDELRAVVQERIDRFENHAPVSAAEAAQQMLQGVREGRWRILIGKDAVRIDALARSYPEELYQPAFLATMSERLAESV